MRDKIIEIIEEIGADIDVTDPDLNIAEDMESIDIISLIADLEDEFDITITMKDKTEANFRNVDTLAEMVERLL